MSKHTPTPWMPCGQGTLLHPVTGAAITTEVIEAKGWGRIGEWYDYSNEPEDNFDFVLRACNNHDPLLNMLQRMVDEAGGGAVCPLTLEHARYAIAKAKTP